ncbi:MAG TPA: hypothetical protein VE195_10935 [Acidobacteriaceae bacterium]|nr:hypothetical protein [Acidobacteriaceae bacterium]
MMHLQQRTALFNVDGDQIAKTIRIDQLDISRPVVRPCAVHWPRIGSFVYNPKFRIIDEDFFMAS